MAEITEAGVKFVIEDLDKYLRGIKDANGETSKIGTTADKAAIEHGRAVDKMQRDATDKYDKMGKAAMKMGALVAGAVVAVGLAALKIAGDFDDAVDTIQVGTGATGKDLEALKKSFENVFTSIPADGGDIAKAMTAISQKTGATGKPLETLTSQVVQLSRITGTDLDANVEAVTGAIQRWGLSASTAAPFLDELFRISQESGVPVSELARSLKDNKGILDQLGLPLRDSARLIGALGKAGIDSDAAFAGMRVALVKMAKDGIKDPAAEMQKYFDRIKNAKTDADATAIAVDLFGKQSIGMASAIRDGSFDLKAFNKAVDDNKGSIEDTARQTDDWKEKLTLLKNRALVELAPAAERVFKAVGEAVEKVQPSLDDFLEWFDKDIKPSLMEFKRVFENDIQPAISAFLRFLDTVLSPGVKAVFDTIGGYISNVTAVVTGVITTLSALKDGRWGEAWDGLKDVAINALKLVAVYPQALWRLFDAYFGDEIRAFKTKVVGWIDEFIVAPFTNATGFAAAATTWFTDMLGAVRTGALEIRKWLVDNLRFYVVDPALELADKVRDAILGGFEAAAGKVGDVVKRIGNTAISVFNNILGAIGGFVNKFGDAVNWISSNLGLGDLLPDWGTPSIQALRTGGVARGGPTLVGEGGPELVNLPAGARVFNAQQTAGMLAGVGGLPGWDDIKDGFETLTDAVRDFISDIIEKGTEWLVDKALAFAGVDAGGVGLPGVFAAIPGKIFGTLKDGLFDAVGGWVDGIKRDVGFATGEFGLPMAPGSYHVSQWYGKTPFSSVYAGGVHTGIDMATGGVFGTPIMASDGGTAMLAGGYGGYGNAVMIRHTSNLVSLYGHMESMLVRLGEAITKGQHIGGVGSTGFSTGPHLHFEMRKDGYPVDPRNYVRGFARGGVSAGGMAIVGEEGPELVMLPSGAMVVPSGVTSSLLGALTGMRRGASGLAGAGMRGGTTYHVNASYTNPQSPQSIRLDLEAIAMMASA